MVISLDKFLGFMNGGKVVTKPTTDMMCTFYTTPYLVQATAMVVTIMPRSTRTTILSISNPVMCTLFWRSGPADEGEALRVTHPEQQQLPHLAVHVNHVLSCHKEISSINDAIKNYSTESKKPSSHAIHD